MRTPATRFEDLVVWLKAHLILAKDLEYGDISESSQLLEEVSKLLEPIRRPFWILTSDSCLPVCNYQQTNTDRSWALPALPNPDPVTISLPKPS